MPLSSRSSGCSFRTAHRCGERFTSHRDHSPTVLPVAWLFAAASRMTEATALCWESIDTWLSLSSLVVAFIRFAKKRSSSGAIAWSRVETMYHDGFVFHATAETCAANAEALIGPWVAAATSASPAGRSEPNFLK